MKKRNFKNNKTEEVEKIRLNKFIADAGVCSRRKADELIQSGAVQVNGAIIVDLGIKVSPSDKVTVMGDQIKSSNKLVYILFNKPKNLITTTSDDRDRKTVLDVVKSNSRIFPVGRLDRNTTGVLLLTNDGDLTYRLTHPKYSIERVYNAKLDKELRYNDAEKIAAGVEMDQFTSSPCELFINPKEKSKVTISLREGKNHEVKLLFESQGYVVKQLDRKLFAGVTYQGLKKGQYRHLTKKELLALKRLVKLT